MARLVNEPSLTCPSERSEEAGGCKPGFFNRLKALGSSLRPKAHAGVDICCKIKVLGITFHALALLVFSAAKPAGTSAELISRLIFYKFSSVNLPGGCDSFKHVQSMIEPRNINRITIRAAQADYFSASQVGNR